MNSSLTKEETSNLTKKELINKAYSEINEAIPKLYNLKDIKTSKKVILIFFVILIVILIAGVLLIYFFSITSIY